eukprot:2080058-Pleurochrysis_carterae.AAC.4
MHLYAAQVHAHAQAQASASALTFSALNYLLAVPRQIRRAKAACSCLPMAICASATRRAEITARFSSLTK